MKKFLYIMLSMLLCVCLTLSGCAAKDDNSRQIMYEQDSERIIRSYPEEIDYVERCAGITVKRIDAGTIKIIRDVQINAEGIYPEQDENSRLDEMVTEIVDAILWYRSDCANEQNGIQLAATGTTLNHTYTRVNTTAANLRGSYVCELSVGSSVSFNNDFSLSAGTTIKLNKIFTLNAAFGYSDGVSRAYAGPSSTDTLTDGKVTTHHIMFKVLSGYLVLHEYDYINEYGQITHFSVYEIEKDTARVTPYTAYGSASNGGVYVQNSSKNSIRYYSGWYEMENAVELTPDLFI